MKRFLRFFFLLLSVAGYSQSDITWTFYNLGVKSTNNEDALYWFNKARETTLEDWSDTLSGYFPISQIVAYQYKQIGDYASAISIDEETLEKAQIVYGEESLFCADLLHSISGSHYKLNNYNNALQIEETACKLYEKHQGEKNENYIISLNMVALYEDCIGNFEKAIEDQFKVIALAKTVFGDNSINYATYVANLSKYYDDIGDYSNAIEWGETALAIYLKDAGENHPKYINMLNTLGVIYEHIQNYPEAIRLGEEAVAIQKENYGEMNSDYALFLDNLSNSYINCGQVIKGKVLAQKSLDINIQLYGDNQPSLIIPLNNLTVACAKEGNFEQAIEYCEEAASIIKTMWGEDNLRYATVITNLGHCYSKQGDFTKALLLEEKALLIKKEFLVESHRDISASISNISSLYYEMGDYQKAISLLKHQAELIEREYGETNNEYAGVLNNLAVMYSKIEDPFSALEINTKVLNIRKTILGEQHPDYIQSLINVSVDYEGIGQYQKALDCLLLCESFFNSTREPFPSLELEVYNNLAMCYSQQDDSEKALEYYFNALSTSKTIYGENNLVVAKILRNIASVLAGNGELEQGLLYANNALELFSILGGEKHPEYANTLGDISWMLFISGDFEKSNEVRMRQMAIIEELYGKDSPVLIDPLTWAFVTSTAVGNNKDAIIYLQRSMELSNINVKHGFRHLTQSQKESYWHNCEMLFSLAQNALFGCINKDNKDLIKQTYNSILLSKGILLSSEIGLRNVIYNSGDDALIEAYLYSQRSRLQLEHLTTNDKDTSISLDSVRLAIEAMDKEIYDKAVEDSDYLTDLDDDFDTIVKRLNDNDVVIEFAENSNMIDGGYFAFLYRKSWDLPLVVELGKAEEFRFLGFKDYQAYRESAGHYYNMVWKKLEENIHLGDDVYFSPSGLLHQINIEVLHDSTGMMVGEKYQLHRVSSSRQVCQTFERIDYTSAAVFGDLYYDMDTIELEEQSLTYQNKSHHATRGFVADSLYRAGWSYLPGTKFEIEHISTTMQNHGIAVNLYTEKTGTEESFKSLSGKHFSIIHIATHGFFFKNEEAKTKPFFQGVEVNESDALGNSLKRSGLIFAGGQNAWLGGKVPPNVEDGILLAEEIATMDLSGTDLVVLSACETGLGDITSDGVFGLQRAFKMAGVQTLVMSLWKVDDNATSLMMQTFYEHLLSDMSKREAFNLAQAAVREKYPEPYYWAGFIMLD